MAIETKPSASSPFTEAQTAMEMAEALCRDFQEMIDTLIGKAPPQSANDPGPSSSITGIGISKVPSCDGMLGQLEAQSSNLRAAVNRTYGYISRARAAGIVG